MSTEMLLDALAQGLVLELPPVSITGDTRSHYSDEELALMDATGDALVIESVELVGEDEVQCISVADGEHVYVSECVATHNTANVIFLKSNDDAMIETLSKLSGVMHESYRDSKTVTVDVQRIALRNDPKVSYTTSTREKPIISFNDLAYLPLRNAIVFCAGDAPIWNTRSTILPMSYRLFKNTIRHYGHEYSLPTVPTLSTAREFDVRKNQPPFIEMFNRRMSQALKVEEATAIYKSVHGISDEQMSELDPDVKAAEIMDIINELVDQDERDADAQAHALVAKGRASGDMAVVNAMAQKKRHSDGAVPNEAFETEWQKSQNRMKEGQRFLFAGGMLSVANVIDLQTGGANRSCESVFLEAYDECRHSMENDSMNFSFDQKTLSDARSGEPLVIYRNVKLDFDKARSLVANPKSNVYAEEDALDDRIASARSRYELTDQFFLFLGSKKSWRDIAHGKFDHAVETIMKREGELPNRPNVY
jgi:hypothetical protein